MLPYIVQFLSLSALTLAASDSRCKATPGTEDWPSLEAWSDLNTTISGRLIKSVPPGAVCHPDQPTYNEAACPAVQAGWLTTAWHAEDPISVSENSWNNDTCLPIPTAPCSGDGYPIYVVNATSAEDVKAGVDFARENNVRLIVKATGHDYLGRSSGPNSLSIWTHHLRGLKFHNGFTPKGCNFKKPIDTHAITAAAGTQMLELNEQAHLRNLTIVSGGAGTVGVGGYLTGGGHAALSSTYGLAVDQVLEIELVTPGGDILTVNECQNRDLFWAMRGGGGSTFGVMTSVSFKAFPSAPFHTALVVMGTLTTGTEAYWDVIASILSKYPSLEAVGISNYFFIVSAFNATTISPEFPPSIDGLYGLAILPGLSSANTSSSLVKEVENVINSSIASYPAGQFFASVSPTSYPDFWGFYKDNNGPLDANHDQALGSRLLDKKALTGNLTALKEAYKAATPAGGIISAYLVGGRGVWNAKPRGGSNAVLPAWRKSYVHSISGVSWPAFDAVEKAKQEKLLTGTYVEALRKLAPDTGSYLNEAYANEPDYQHAFWGDNYERLARIKKRVDPDDVLWCHPCVGNEGWEVVDGVLCRV